MAVNRGVNPLRDLISDLQGGRAKAVDFGPVTRANVVLHDDADGNGPYVAIWDTNALGPAPKESDGFSKHQVKKVSDQQVLIQDEPAPSAPLDEQAPLG